MGKVPETWWFKIPPLPKDLYYRLKEYERRTSLSSGEVVQLALRRLLGETTVPQEQPAPADPNLEKSARYQAEQWTPQEWVKAGKTGPPPGYVEKVYDEKVVWVPGDPE